MRPKILVRRYRKLWFCNLINSKIIIGSSYPNATGDPAAHNMQVEQCANMIIIALAHAQATGDGSLLNRYVCMTSFCKPWILAHSQLSSMTNSANGQISLSIIHGIWRPESEQWLLPFLFRLNLLSNGRTTSISDGIIAANQTNLALKGIIGLGAMARISNYTGQQTDSDYFQVFIINSCWATCQRFG